MRSYEEKSLVGKPSIGALGLCCALLAACSGLGGNSDKELKTTVAPASTPSQRAVQVAWTAASARYCAFGLNPQKLKGDYLAWETSHGASPETIATLGSTYDKAFLTFYAKVKDTPGYCSKARIEEIRPDINRHLAGDYEPRKKKLDVEDVSVPQTNKVDKESFEDIFTPGRF